MIVAAAPVRSFAIHAGVLFAFTLGLVRADELPLHERIDRLIEANLVGPISPACNDADFVRRVWLDLAGMVPPAAAAKEFLDNPAPDKRAALIDKLLAGPHFLRHFTLALDVGLMERRPEKAVKSPEWQQYLWDSLAKDKPLDQLYRELIAADGVSTAPRAAVRFLLDRDCESNSLTRDIGRLLFGRDLQCAQCHDHPLTDDYLQAEYYGLAAFVARSSSFNDAKAKQLQVAEKGEGETSFQSVFTKTGSDRTPPRLPLGCTVVDPPLEKGDEYVVAPAKDVRHVPKHSRRAQLAARLAESEQFRRNAANRIWAMLMGRGLVHPLDGHSAANPPTHPQVLALLGDELTARKFDLKYFLRELALTRVYQRSCDPPPATQFDFASLDPLEKTLTAEHEQLAANVAAARMTAERLAANWKLATEERAKRLAELTPLETAVGAARQTHDKAAKELDAAKAAFAKREAPLAAVVEAATKAKAAAGALPEDKILAEAAAKIAERQTALETELKTASEKVTAVAAPVEAALTQLTAAREALVKARTAQPTDDAWLAIEREERTAVRKKLDAEELLAAVDARLSQIKTLREYQQQLAVDPALAAKTWERLVDGWTVRGQVAPLKGLTAEQLTFSLLQASYNYDLQLPGAKAAVEKAAPDEWKNAAEADKPRVLERLVEQKLLEQNRGPISIFVGLYDAAAGQEFQATANQALFFGNNGQVISWLTGASGTLVERLSKTEDPAATADELYLAVYSRRPTNAEKTAVAEFLAERKADRLGAVQEIVWSLLASNEFRFNH